MKTKTLIIIFNNIKTQYMELTRQNGELVNERMLKRKPRAARFDCVMETEEGSYTQWNAHRAKTLYSHPLKKD